VEPDGGEQFGLQYNHFFRLQIMRVIMNVEPGKGWLGQHKEIKYEITVVSSGSKSIQALVCVCLVFV